jgi:hypothetical protein
LCAVSHVFSGANLVSAVHIVYLYSLAAELRFEWDPGKARANVQIRGISFDEAETAFSDDHALIMPEREHSSAHEEPLVLLGLDAALASS